MNFKIFFCFSHHSSDIFPAYQRFQTDQFYCFTAYLTYKHVLIHLLQSHITSIFQENVYIVQ
jgi:hypothetical protein